MPLTLLLIGLLACALGPLISADTLPLGMLLSYPPRLPLAVVATLLAGLSLRRGSKRRALLALLAAATLCTQLGWPRPWLRPAPCDSDSYTLIAMNVRNEAEGVPTLAALCEKQAVDLLVLQEVKASTRAAWIAGLPQFEFFGADQSASFEHDDWGPFTSLIGLRRELVSVGSTEAPIVHTAITGYRSFAVQLQLGSHSLQVVNVHTTKAFWLQGSALELLSRAAYKANWHAGESTQLRAWLAAHDQHPTLIAGDFNAPLGSRALELPKMSHAQLVAGSGPHLSIPASFPIWGIDHVLGSSAVQFDSYELLDLGFSDHRAQLVRFCLR